MSKAEPQTDNHREPAPEVIQSISQLNRLSETTQLELEAAAFRKLLSHLEERVDVQNIDLMNLAGFCRNCLSKWYRSAASERGIEIEDLIARERVYGMPYAEWKTKHQK